MATDKITAAAQATFLIDTLESLSPVLKFIKDHHIQVIPAHEYKKHGEFVKVPWIAEYDGLYLTGGTRDEAVLNIAKSFALRGWENISWNV